MIQYIEIQLCAWGRWAMRQATRSVGYPSVSPMFRDMKSGGGYGSREPFGVDEYVGDTATAVERLEQADRRVCVERYQVGGKAEEIAARLGMSKATLFRRVDAIHLAVLGHLNDIAAAAEREKAEARVHTRSRGSVHTVLVRG